MKNENKRKIARKTAAGNRIFIKKKMKPIPVLLALACLPLAGLLAQNTHSLVKKWETDSILKTPESVLYSAKDKILYVSNIDGAPDGKDGRGSVGKVGLDGKVIEVDWVKGLNAPKGLGIYKNRMYVADLSEVAVIDMDQAAIVQRIPVEGAVFLNDITVDAKTGTVYVSDTRTMKVHRIERGLVSTVLEKLQAPNGLFMDGDELLILDKGSLLRMSPTGALSTVTVGMDPSTDGVEKVRTGEYIASCWNGVIYYVFSDGNKQLLLDTRAEKMNTADIGYDAKNRIVYVPTFFSNRIIAYELK